MLCIKKTVDLLRPQPVIQPVSNTYFLKWYSKDVFQFDLFPEDDIFSKGLLLENVLPLPESLIQEIKDMLNRLCCQTVQLAKYLKSLYPRMKIELYTLCWILVDLYNFHARMVHLNYRYGPGSFSRSEQDLMHFSNDDYYTSYPDHTNFFGNGNQEESYDDEENHEDHEDYQVLDHDDDDEENHEDHEDYQVLENEVSDHEDYQVLEHEVYEDHEDYQVLEHEVYEVSDHEDHDDKLDDEKDVTEISDDGEIYYDCTDGGYRYKWPPLQIMVCSSDFRIRFQGPYFSINYYVEDGYTEIYNHFRANLV
jgi:hypothetical protein